MCVGFRESAVYLDPGLWCLQRKSLQKSSKTRVLTNLVLCVDLPVFVLSGRVRGGNCFGSGIWGSNGSHWWHSSEALSTDQVALHWAVVDHRSLAVTELALAQVMHTSTSVDHYCSPLLWSEHKILVDCKVERDKQMRPWKQATKGRCLWANCLNLTFFFFTLLLTFPHKCKLTSAVSVMYSP